MKRNKTTLFITQAAIIAAIYTVLTVGGASFGFKDIQLRFSEALTILPFFTPAAIPGLFVGCLISNLLSGAILLDVIGGSLATLLAAVLSYLLRKHKYLVCVPPIVVNALVVPFILKFGYELAPPIWLMMITVGIGEILSCGLLGTLLLKVLDSKKEFIFHQN